MQVITHRIPGGPHRRVAIAPLGDFQWSGSQGPTSLTMLRKHIQWATADEAWFVGMGDYIDFLSPSNRQRLRSAALYDTAEEVIDMTGMNLVAEIRDAALLPTVGRWLGLIEGHHFTQLKDGSTTDSRLAEMLGCPFLGTSAIINVEFLAEVGIGPGGLAGSESQSRLCHAVFYVHHGLGGGTLPSAPLNKLYHVSAGFERIDVFLMGHTTKTPVTRLSKPYPDWDEHDLNHPDILLVNTGGFSKSSIVGHMAGPIPRGDYAEQKMLTPSPLTAPIVYLFPPDDDSDKPRIKVLV